MHITTFSLILILPLSYFKNCGNVRTPNKIKHEVPKLFQASQDRRLLSTKFGSSKEHHLMMC